MPATESKTNAAEHASNAPRPTPTASTRLIFLDQMRGYAIAGMILVNFLGDFEVMPWTLKHHREGMSYADTIAPLFMFVVGMGFRLSALRRIREEGRRRAYLGLVSRYLGLTAVGVVFYGSEWRYWWDALVDIGVAGLLAIPFVEASRRVRAAAPFISLAVFQSLYSFTDYGAWTFAKSINGGPLGPLSWVFILLMGTLAMDWLRDEGRRALVIKSLVWGLSLSALGWAFRAAWGDLKPFWPFSQYAMTAPYALYSAGLSFLTIPLFILVCDTLKITIPTWTVMGRNALVLYLVHFVVMSRQDDLFPGNATATRALLGFAALYAICWAVARKLHRDGVVIKL